jgi:hypothetical protein
MSEAARPPASRSSPWITAALSSARKMAAIASAARAASVVAIFVSDLCLRSRLVPKATQPTDSEFDARLVQSLSNESAGSFERKP